MLKKSSVQRFKKSLEITVPAMALLFNSPVAAASFFRVSSSVVNKRRMAYECVHENSPQENTHQLTSDTAFCGFGVSADKAVTSVVEKQLDDASVLDVLKQNRLKKQRQRIVSILSSQSGREGNDRLSSGLIRGFQRAGMCNTMDSTCTSNGNYCTADVDCLGGNNAPTVTGTPSDPSISEDTESNIDLSAFTFTDADGDNLTVTLTASEGTFSTPADGAGVGAGVIENLTSSTVVTLAGSAADINTYLDTTSNIKYTGASNDHGDNTSTITVSATDGNGGSLAHDPVVMIDISAAADTPSVASPTINEDADSGALAITRAAADGAETTHYQITSISNGTLYSDAGFTTQINNSDFIASAGATTNVYFRPTSNFNGSGGFTVQASSANNVGGLAGSTSNSTVTIDPVNDAAALNLDADDSSGAGGNDFAATFLAGGSAVKIADTDTALTDIDDTNMESAVITLSGGVVDGVNESLSISGTPATMGGVSIAYTSAIQIDLSASATLAEYQAVMEAIEYNNSAAGAATGGDRTISVKVNDGENDSNTATATITVKAMPKMTSATYDASTGQLVITGTDFVAQGGATNDLIASMLTITGEGGTYTLTDSNNVEISSATEATVTLSSTDKLHIAGLLNKDGLSSAGATYNLAAADGWMPQAPDDESDLTGNAITVSNVAVPTITSATYDADTGVVVVTGTNFSHKVGANNDIDVSTITFTGGTGDATYNVTSATDVEITSATSFSFALAGADKTQVDALLDQIGTSSSGGSTYNIAGADDWMTGADSAANIADPTGNAVTVVINPKITTSTYDAGTGLLVVTGTNIQTKTGVLNDIDVSRFTFTGEGGATYQLTDTIDVERTSVTQFTLSLTATDKAAVNQMLNKDGTSSTSGTTYNLAAADDWDTNVTAGDTSDTTNNPITVSNVPAPAVTSATYNAASGVLNVTGTGFLKFSGAVNDIDISKLILTGEGAATHILSSSNVEITSGTTFSVVVNSTDKAALNQILNKNGTASTGATTYNLNAAEDWAAGADASVIVTDGTGNGITVSNVTAPVISNASYDAATGVLSVIGTGFLKYDGATNDIDVSKLTLTGEGGATHTLTSSSVEIASGTTFSVTVNGADRAAVNQIINKDGTASTDSTTYNLNAAEDWAAGAYATVNVVDAAGNSISASNVAVPTLTSATYDANSNVLTITGTGLLQKNGAVNDIDISKFTVTGEAGATHTLTSASDVEITSGTQFSITLAGADLTNIEALLNKNGSSSIDTTAYNLAAAEDWAAGADAAVSVVDATGNGITVSNVTSPTVTSATYNWSTGQLVVTGTGFVNNSGASNDVDASTFTFTGEGGSYQLTDSGDVEISSATTVTVILSAIDQLNVHGLLNKDGVRSSGGTTYNLAAADNWLTAAPAVTDITDATGNGITVSNVATPNITSATYNADTGDVTITGANLFKKVGSSNDIDVSLFTFKGEGAAIYQLAGATDVEITSVTSVSFTLSGADKTQVDLLLDKPGTSSSDGTVYNIAAVDNWLVATDAATDISDATNGVTVSSNPKITSATYDGTTGTLVVTGTNIQANASADVDASMLKVTGQGGVTYTLTDTADVNRDAETKFTLTLSATDKTAVNVLLNNAGTASADATPYNLAAADDWNTAITAGNSADPTGNAITVANTAPTLSNLHGDSVKYIVGSDGIALDASDDATVVDSSSANFDGGNVTVSIIANGQAGEDVLSIGNVGNISTSGSNVTHGVTTIGTFTGGTGGIYLVISLNTNATVLRVQDLVGGLQYTDTDVNTVNMLARTVRVVVNDGDGGSDTSSNQDITVNLVIAPTIDLDGDDSSGASSGGYRGSFVENGGPVAVADSDSTISDDGTFKSITVTLSNHPDSSVESLNSSFGSGAQTVNSEAVTIGAYDSGTGMLTITVDDGSASAVTMRLLIESIRYNNNSDNPDTSDRNINFAGTDNADNTGLTSTAVLTVTAVNDPPVFTGTPAIIGTAKVRKTLGLIDTDTYDVDMDTVTLSYQWSADGTAIEGATFSTYTLTAGEKGQSISCTLAADDGNSGVVTATTAGTGNVENSSFPWNVLIPGLVSPNKVSGGR